MKKVINSFKEFHSLVPAIIEQINKDQKMAIRALANPLLAFRELGYTLTEEVEKEVEYIIRYLPQERKKMEDIEAELIKYTGVRLDLRKPEVVEKLVTEKLKLKKTKNIRSIPGFEPRVSAMRIRKSEEPASEKVRIKTSMALSQKEVQVWKDPLEELKKGHPAIPLLLEYRKILYGKPGFISQDQYDRIKSGKRKLPITGVKVVFRGHHANGEE